MRSPEEFRRIQDANRTTLGMAGAQYVRTVPLGTAGLGDGIFGAALGAAGPIEVGSAFPPFVYQYDPTQPAAPATTGSALSNWLLIHVFRPYIDIGNGSWRYDPGAGQANYSGVAAVGAVVVGLGVLGTLAWVLIRAFGGGRRSNPRARTSTRVYVSRRPA